MYVCIYVCMYIQLLTRSAQIFAIKIFVKISQVLLFREKSRSILRLLHNP